MRPRRPYDPRRRLRKRKTPEPPLTGTVSGLAESSAEGAEPPEELRTDWSDVALWYDALVGQYGSEYHQKVVLPGVLRLLNVGPADVVLDIACGQGVLCRLLHERGATVVGVDASSQMLRLARERSDPAIRYELADARNLAPLPDNHFTAAACVLAIQNIDPIEPVFQSAARVLRNGGRFVLVMMHPAFRVPRHAHWQWDAQAKVQYRRVERYLLPMRQKLAVHPGIDPSRQVWVFHRPLHSYINALAAAGLFVDRMEEWTSHKRSEPGPRAEAENTARREIPLFLAMRAIKMNVP